MSRSPITTKETALVMASSQGLGYASAEALLRQGYHVVITSRSHENLARARDSLLDIGPVTAITVDVSNLDELARLIEQLVDEIGPISVLVVNAGGPPLGGFTDLTNDDWAHAFQLTLMSAVTAIRGVIPGMQSRSWGRIVVLGSSSVKRPLPNLTLSNVFRPALAGMVKDLAITLAGEGITVNLVAPGRMDTERVASLDRTNAERQGVSAEEARQASESAIPLGRYGKPQELGELVAFLASEAAGYLTGQTILVDGGMVPTLP